MYSIEELIMESTGLKSQKPVNFSMKSIPNFSGYTDEIIKDVTQASEDLQFYETYAKINQKNCADKMRMLKRINNIFAQNCYDKQAKQTMESYIYKQAMSTEADAQTTGGTASAASNMAQKAQQMQEGVEKKKGNFFKRIIKAIKDFIRKIINFIKLVINKIITFIRSIGVDTQNQKLVDKNPFTEKGEVYYNFSSFNFGGAKSFCSLFEKVKTKINKKTNNGTIDSNAERDVESFLKKLKAKVKFDWEADDADKGRDGKKAAVAWYLFGLKMCDGAKSYNSANIKKLVLLGQEQEKILPRLQKVNTTLDQSFGPLLELSEKLERGEIKEVNGAWVNAANSAINAATTNMQSNNMRNADKEKADLKQEAIKGNGRNPVRNAAASVYGAGAAVGRSIKNNLGEYSVVFGVDNFTVEIVNTKNFNAIIGSIKKVITVTNIAVGIANDIAAHSRQLIVQSSTEIEQSRKSSGSGKI